MKRANSQEFAYARIKEQIISLKMKPGSRIHAHDLAKQLELSRTPIREALSRLEQEGLVARTTGWGYTVRLLGLKDIIDLFRLRDILEVEAALEALKHMDSTTLEKLHSIHKRAQIMLSKGRLAEFRALNREFHLSIGLAAQNELLYRMLLMLNDRILLIGSMHIELRAHRAKEIDAENQRILEALSAGQAKRLKSAVLAHIKNAREGLLRT